MSTSWLGSFRFTGPRKGNTSGDRGRKNRSPLSVEPLEDRTVPAVGILNHSGQGYTGLDFNSSGGYVPPDTCGAAGPSGYVETVNQAVALYDKSGGSRLASDSLSHFLFSVGGLTRADSGSGLSDPIVTYDELAGRYVIGDQDVNFNTHVSSFDLAVSKTATPTTFSSADWNFYKITTTESGFDADYPGNFGYNRDGLVFTLNMFGVTGGGHAQVVSVDSNDLTNGVSQANLHSYRNDLNDFSLRPTTMHGSAAGAPMWLVTEHGDNRSIDVIKMTSSNGTILSNSDTFSYTNLPVTAYSGAVSPRNPNGTAITTNVDSRIMKAAEANNVLVAAHSVGVSSTQDAVQWYAIDLSGATPALAQQGRVAAGNNTYLTYPGIDINPSGQIGMSYMRSGSDTSSDYMSMWVTGRTAADATGTMETPVVVPTGTGQANYKDFSSGGRAGDLSGISIDPADGSFWAANEFANTEATANWGTAIANFSLGGTTNTTDLAVALTGPSSVTAGTNATYTLTLTNNGPNAAQGVVLTDYLPAGSLFVSMTPALGNPDVFTSGQSGGTVTESAGSVAAGHTDVFTLVVTAPGTLLNGADFSDRATVSSSTSDGNAANNSATVTGTVANAGSGADLAVANTGSAASVLEGDTVTYTVTVTNSGPSDATGVALTDSLGTNLNFVSATTSQGSFSQSNGVVTFSIGTVPNGGSVTMTVTARAAEEGNLTDSASVTATTNDTASGNNSSVATTAVGEAPIVVSAPITVSQRSLSNSTVATFTHANGVEPAGAFTALIDWGDGKTSAGTVVQLSDGSYAVTGSHRYTKNGSHTITTTVTESGNQPDGYFLPIKIDPDGPELPDRLGNTRSR